MLLFILAIGLALIISLIMAEAEVVSPFVPIHSPVIPPRFKTHLKQLVRRIRYDGVLYVERRLKEIFRSISVTLTNGTTRSSTRHVTHG